MNAELNSDNAILTHIRPSRGMPSLDMRTLWQYHDLLFFLVWRDIKVRYAQSILGIGWAVVQPAIFMIVFTIFFGNLVKISSDGAPYAVFSYTALVPWTYFSTALVGATGTLVQNSNMLTKIYFPRLYLPASAIVGRLVDFSIALIMVFALMAWFRITPTLWVFALPWFVVLMVITAAGLSMWLAALAVQYRDVIHASTFLVQLLMYAAPVVYPASVIPDKYRLWYALNPMVGVIEGFRSALLGTNPMPWDLLIVGSASAVLVGVGGLIFFRRMEHIFADVV